MRAIITKYHGATNTRGSRISARDGMGLNRIYIPYPHELDGEPAHRLAAEALRDRMQWKGALVSGGTKDGYVFVFVS